MKILNLNFSSRYQTAVLAFSKIWVNPMLLSCKHYSLAVRNYQLQHVTLQIRFSVQFPRLNTFGFYYRWQTGTSFNNLSKLDISYNPASTSGLTSFLALSPSLCTLIMKGLNLQHHPDQLSQLLGGIFAVIVENGAFLELIYLKDLRIGKTQMVPSALEYIFSSCNQLVNLDLSSADLTFSFSVYPIIIDVILLAMLAPCIKKPKNVWLYHT